MGTAGYRHPGFVGFSIFGGRSVTGVTVHAQRKAADGPEHDPVIRGSNNTGCSRDHPMTRGNVSKKSQRIWDRAVPAHVTSKRAKSACP